MSEKGRWLRRVALAMLLGVLTFAALTGRVVAEGRHELTKSDAAFDRGDLREAILYARRAATLYAPGAPHVTPAYSRLVAIAAGAEASNQSDVARQAWGAVRAAALETRHIWTPRAADLDLANRNLARLATAGPSMDRGKMAAVLARDDAPEARWVLVLGAGFALFAAGLGLAAARGVSADGRISVRGLCISAAVALLGVACWTLAVYRA